MCATIRRFAAASLALSASLLLVSIASAVELAPNAPSTYIVRSGDTLWDIAGRFLRDPWRWSEVWQANPGLDDPDLIYPGDVLQLSMVGGEPRIRAARGGGRTAEGMRVVRLSPRVRSSSLTAAVPTIPVSKIAPFLTQPYVADSDDIERASYVVGFPEEHIIAGLNDSIYVRQIRSSANTNFQILRPGDELRDPDTNELLGYEAVFIANAALERTGDPAKLRIVRNAREVSIGDRVIPSSVETPLENFFPRPAPEGTRGRVLSVLNGVSQIGPYDVVVINRGARDGIDPGHVFAVFVGGSEERDQVKQGGFMTNWREVGPLTKEFWLGQDYDRKGWRRDEPSPNEPLPIHADYRKGQSSYYKPFEHAGLMMVFRTFDRVSFALILKASRFINVGDWVSPPVSQGKRI